MTRRWLDVGWLLWRAAGWRAGAVALLAVVVGVLWYLVVRLSRLVLSCLLIASCHVLYSILLVLVQYSTTGTVLFLPP